MQNRSTILQCLENLKAYHEAAAKETTTLIGLMNNEGVSTSSASQVERAVVKAVSRRNVTMISKRKQSA